MQGAQRMSEKSCFRYLSLIVNLAVMSTAASGSSSFLNINIKSRTLSNILNEGNTNNQTIFSRQTLQDTFDKMLHVDFSGHIQTHLFGPPVDMTDFSSTQPLIEPLFPIFKRSNVAIPRLFAGCSYDFARSRFGATRLDATLRWNLPGETSPATVELRTRKGIFDQVDDIHECTVQWAFPGGAPLVVKGEHAAQSSRFSCSIPVHRRINYELQIQSTDRSKDGRHVQDFDAINQDWWLPNVTIRPAGTMESANSAVIRHPFPNKWGGNYLGIRFMARRQLNWSAFPTSMDEDETGTSLVCEFQELGPHQASSLNLRVQTLLERPFESLRLSIIQNISPKLFATL